MASDPPTATGSPTDYELVSLKSGDRIGERGTAEELLRDVRYLVGLRGPAAVAGIGLGQVDGQGYVRSILAEGRALLDLAEGACALTR